MGLDIDFWCKTTLKHLRDTFPAIYHHSGQYQPFYRNLNFWPKSIFWRFFGIFDFTVVQKFIFQAFGNQRSFLVHILLKAPQRPKEWIPQLYITYFYFLNPKSAKKMKFLSFWIFEVDLSCSSVHARARWNLKFDVISGGSSIKIEN